MKKHDSLTSNILSRFVGGPCVWDVFIYLFLISVLIASCTGKMSVEEAKQVTVSMSGKSLVAPPRRIDDILVALDQSSQYNPAISENYRDVINKPRPQTDNAATLTSYYHQTGDAAGQIGQYNRAVGDLRLAFKYSIQAGGPNHKLLNSLAYAEFASGNFKKAIEIFEQSLRKSGRQLIADL